nr:GFA family protein [Pseudoruegeria sp. HB172150]
MPLTGGCQCGALRYRITAAPVTCYACHCTLCQRQSGSGFGMSLQCPDDSVELEGPSASLEWTGGSGRLSRHTFCPACGVRVTHQIEGSPVIVIKPGTLDDTSWLRPAGHIFTATRQPWVPEPSATTLVYEDRPDMPALHAHWKRMLEAGAGA